MKKIFGDKNKIDLSTSSFKNMIRKDNFYIDKTPFIEHFLTNPNSVQLIVRQRRLGKSLNMDMLACFLTEREDNRELFKNLYVESSPVWPQVSSAPVLYFDFKNLSPDNYRRQIFDQIAKYMYLYLGETVLSGFYKMKWDDFMNNKGENTEGLLFLTQFIYQITGKASYILIDEYDKLLMDNYSSEKYKEIKNYETQLFTAALKGNDCLEKALLTGVMRISRESILSGLNNLKTYDLFTDEIYQRDFGVTEEEIEELSGYFDFDREKLKKWYNGVCINQFPIYNIYSVLSCLQEGKYDNYWGRSGTIGMIVRLLNEKRLEEATALLNGETILTAVSHRISLHDMLKEPTDSQFYSLLVQSGYLALLKKIEETSTAHVCIPNQELMNVWKEFILSEVVKEENTVMALFKNINAPDLFSRDLQYYLSGRLSYYDIGRSGDSRNKERFYHIFVLGLLSAYDDMRYRRMPLSNKESGEGRYDLLFETKKFAVIFEFKTADKQALTEKATDEALKQIDEKRYFAAVQEGKMLIKTGIAFCGNNCIVKSVKHIWN